MIEQTNIVFNQKKRHEQRELTNANEEKTISTVYNGSVTHSDSNHNSAKILAMDTRMSRLSASFPAKQHWATSSTNEIH